MTNRPKPTKTEMWIIFYWNDTCKKWIRSIMTDEIFSSPRAADQRIIQLTKGRSDHKRYERLPVTIIANPAPPPKEP